MPWCLRHLDYYIRCTNHWGHMWYLGGHAAAADYNRDATRRPTVAPTALILVNVDSRRPMLRI